MKYCKTFEVSTRAQVLVVGAGLGGIAAAVAAARSGADTLLIERNGYPGGVATAGHCCSLFNCFFMDDGTQAVGGIPYEIACELANKAGGPGDGWQKHRGHMIFDVEKAKMVLTDFMLAAGVRVRYFTPLSDVVTEDGKIKGVLVTGRNGLEYIEADTFVDATGDSDLAVRAGCPYRTIEGKASYLFRLGNVDMDKVVDYFRKNPNEYVDHVDIDWEVQDAIRQYDETGTFLFPHGGGEEMTIFKEAIASGEFQKDIGTQTRLDALQMHGIRKTGTIHVITGFTPVASLDADTLTERTHEGRQLMFYVAEFMKKRFPGMENSYVASMADDLGVRMSRVITNANRLTKEMQITGGRCEGSAGHCTVVIGHKKPGQVLGVQTLGQDYFDVPLKALIPDAIDNLIMGAGRSISAQNLGLIRVMVNTMVVGQAAGTTAATAALSGSTVRDADYAVIRERLEAFGAFDEF